MRKRTRKQFVAECMHSSAGKLLSPSGFSLCSICTKSDAFRTCVIKNQISKVFFHFFYNKIGSLFIDGKAITGSKIPSEKNHISKLTGVLIKNNTSLKGFGIFISYRYFLTVAQALFEFEGSASDKFVVIPPELLTIQTENNVHNVLCYEMHRHYVLEKYINNIAVALVSSQIKNPMVLTK